MLNGFINLYKEKGISSNKALSILKFHLIQNNIFTKAGHFGTLDPEAEGVLPVALGRATRLFDYTIHKKKVYRTSFLFGKETDTLDLAGEVIKEEAVSITKEDILDVLYKFIGNIPQVPPKYSAKSIGGKRAYALARKGIEFSLKPKLVEVFSIDILSQIDKNHFEFRIVCGGGAYIRALARDIAKELGTVAVTTSIIREASGDFKISKSVRLSEIENGVVQYILPMDTVLSDYQRIDIDLNQLKDLLDGKRILYKNIPDGFIKVYTDNRLTGIGKRDNSGRLFIKTWLI